MTFIVFSEFLKIVIAKVDENVDEIGSSEKKIGLKRLKIYRATIYYTRMYTTKSVTSPAGLTVYYKHA